MSALCDLKSADEGVGFCGVNLKFTGNSGSLKRKIHYSADDVADVPLKKKNVIFSKGYNGQSRGHSRRGLSERAGNYAFDKVKDESSDDSSVCGGGVTYNVGSSPGGVFSDESSGGEDVFGVSDEADASEQTHVCDRAIDTSDASLTVSDVGSTDAGDDTFTVCADNELDTPRFTDCRKHMGFEMYIDNQLAYFVEHERRTHVVDFLANQKQISTHEWSAEIHWLIQLNDKYGYNIETLHLAVSIFDRMLAKTSVSAECLKLLAVTSFYIASKQEEVVFPSVQQLLRVCHGLYKQSEFFRMEREILRLLNFCVHVPTIHHFVEHCSGCKHHPPSLPHTTQPELEHSDDLYRLLRAKVLARFLTLLIIQDYDLIQQRASILAVAVLQYAFSLLYKDQDWPLSHCVSLFKDGEVGNVKAGVMSLCDAYISNPESRISEYMTEDDVRS